MSISIGTVLPTLIPEFTENSDIQAALRLLYYGSPSGYLAQQWDDLPANSIAYRLGHLDSTKANLSGASFTGPLTLGDVNPETEEFIPGSINGTVIGKDLTLLSSTFAGVQSFLTLPSSSSLWAILGDSTGTGSVVFSNSPSISGGLVFDGSKYPTQPQNIGPAGIGAASLIPVVQPKTTLWQHPDQELDADVFLPFSGGYLASETSESLFKNKTIPLHLNEITGTFEEFQAALYLAQPTDEEVQFVGTSTHQILTNKTLTTPAIFGSAFSGTMYRYNIAGSAISADRTITLPLLTANDVFVFRDFQQTLTNKTLTSPKIGGTPEITGGTMVGTVITTPNTGVGLKDATTAAYKLSVKSNSISPILTSDRVLTLDVNNGDRTISLAGNLTLANSLTTSGNFATTITVTAATNITLPSGTSTLATIDTAQTFSAVKTLTAPVINNGSITGSTIKAGILSVTDGSGNYLKIASDSLSADRTITINPGTANRIITLNGNLVLGNTLTTISSGAITLRGSTSDVTLPTTGTLSTIAGNETLTNKTLTSPKIGDTGAIFDGLTSGSITLKAASVAGTGTSIQLPGHSGTVVVTGDSETVTTGMLHRDAVISAAINIAPPTSPSTGKVTVAKNSGVSTYSSVGRILVQELEPSSADLNIGDLWIW